MLFSLPHIAAICVIIITCALLYIFRYPLKGKQSKRYLRIGLALALILLELSFHMWSVETGQWSVLYTLPFQLCSISTILSAVMLMTKSYPLYEVIYFWGIGGAMQAVLTPEIGIYTFPHFRYFQFFIVHGAIITACLFMTFVEGYRPKLKSVLKALMWLNIYAAFVGLLNGIFGANYLFICSKPEVSSIMDYLGPWPWYILALEAVAAVIFFILYIPFIGKNTTYKSSKGNYINLS